MRKFYCVDLYFGANEEGACGQLCVHIKVLELLDALQIVLIA